MDEYYAVAKAHNASTPMIRLNAVGTNSVILFSHDLVKQWQGYELRGQTKRTIPAAFEKLVGRAFGEMYGQEHLAWRKKAAVSFKPSTLDTYIPFIQESAEKNILNVIHDEALQKGEAVHLNPLAKRFAYDVGSSFVWGPLLDEHDKPRSYELFKKMNNFVPEVFEDLEAKDPNSVFSKMLRAKDELSELLMAKYVEAEQLTADKAWDSKYGESETADCLLRGLMENDAIFDPNGDYTLLDKVDMIQLLTTAAYETSAASLTNLVYTMWQNPEHTEAVRKAILSDPQLSDPTTTFTYSMLKDLNPLECFIQETNRHHSILPMINRTVHDEEGLDFGGYRIPKGTDVTIPIKWLHLGEGSWTETDEFMPERFDKTNGRKKAERGDIGKYNNIPFATGLHKCLGMNLAMLEMRLYSVLLLRDYEIELDESKLNEEGTKNHLQLGQGVPHFNVYLKLKKRQ